MLTSVYVYNVDTNNWNKKLGLLCKLYQCVFLCSNSSTIPQPDSIAEMVFNFPLKKLIPNFSKVVDPHMAVLYFHSIPLLGTFG